MATLKSFNYYYKVDKNLRPIPGSNFKTKKLLRTKNLVQYTPQALLCCMSEEEAQVAQNNLNGYAAIVNTKNKYFVRLDSNNIPLDMSLFRTTRNDFIQGYQPVHAYSCCEPTPPIVTP